MIDTISQNCVIPVICHVEVTKTFLHPKFLDKHVIMYISVFATFKITQLFELLN